MEPLGTIVTECKTGVNISVQAPESYSHESSSMSELSENDDDGNNPWITIQPRCLTIFVCQNIFLFFQYIMAGAPVKHSHCCLELAELLFSPCNPIAPLACHQLTPLLHPNFLIHQGNPQRYIRHNKIELCIIRHDLSDEVDKTKKAELLVYHLIDA